jgi:hypothetical protein
MCPECSRQYSTIANEELQLTRSELALLMRDVISRGKSFRFQAKGLSMSPFVQDGDVIVVAQLPEKGPREGDIVACQWAGMSEIMVHRVIARRSEGHLIKGDNCWRPDTVVDRVDILGWVVSIERGSRCIGFGLGIERYAIAFLSRIGILTPLMMWMRWIIGVIKR